MSVVSNVCWADTPPDRPGETLALQLVQTAEAAARAGDCASASKLGPAVYSADPTVYKLVFLASPALARCEIEPITVSEPPPAPLPRPTPPRPVTDEHPGAGKIGYGKFAVGVGAALWAVSLGLGYDARDKRDQALAAGCTNDFSNCPGDSYSLAYDAYSRGNQATEVFVAGAVLVGIGGLLWLSGSREAQQVHVAPTAGAHEIGLVIEGGL
ncbi:MAG: hypothetical protein JO257_20565 [Deltaproteobacteria bacterium]|nr:hypothetical protein [Deltaproteobacteria bacterium]